MESFKIENLTFKYPSGGRPALNNLHLEIEKGEFLTVCGVSGCGKSTLLRLLKPALAPNGEKSGIILFEGKKVESLDHRMQAEKIGFVMQNPDNQIVTDKVWHELAFGPESMGMENSLIRARVAEMASFFGIEEWFYKKVSELSGGQKQLLNLASVMVTEPSVLILDEPTSQLDPIAAQEFLDAISRINREIGTTVIISEHRLEETFALSDRVVVMEKGRAIFIGKPCEAAAELKKTRSPMIEALPTAARVYMNTENGKTTPVTVKEGREWILDYSKDKNLRKIESEDKCEDEKETVIELEDIYFRYEKNSPDVIKGLSAKIHKGEFYAILGGNGSGKTTTLSLISGINKPYRGSIKINGENVRTGMLPQNPQAIFVEKSVRGELSEILSDRKLSKEEKARFTDEIISLCELEELLDRHPYDLSGGEAQRVALAKVLLLKPDILLLDEPTKGIDAHFKKKLASILLSLKKMGVTIIMVSHDVEFSCKYAERCAMFFDGIIVSENKPRDFFAGKSFYTTAANRMSRGIIKNAVLAEDIIYALTGQKSDTELIFRESQLYEKKASPAPPKKVKRSPLKIITGIIAACAAIAATVLFNGKYTDWRMYAVHTAVFFLLAVSFNFIVPQKKLDGEYSRQEKKENRRLSKSTLISIMVLAVLIPLTIFIGKFYLDDRKYYFISLLIILEITAPFLMSFEKRKPAAREIVVISSLAALTAAGRLALFMLPQFKPMASLVILTGVCLGAESGFLVGAISVFASNFFLSQGPWTPWQMFGFGMVGFLAGILYKLGFLRKTRTSLCVFGLIAIIFFYGPIVNFGNVMMMYPYPTWELVKTSFALGLPFDIIHAASTVFFLYCGAPMIIEKLERLKEKYGIMK